MIASFLLVQVGKGRLLYCRRSWESNHTYDLVISCQKGGPVSQLYHGTPKALWSPVCCETNRRQSHKSMLNRASNVYGTGPELTIECTSSALFQYDPAKGQSGEELRNTIQYSVLSSIVTRNIDQVPDSKERIMNEITSYEASTDSPRREAEVADGYQIISLIYLPFDINPLGRHLKVVRFY